MVTYENVYPQQGDPVHIYSSINGHILFAVDNRKIQFHVDINVDKLHHRPNKCTNDENKITQRVNMVRVYFRERTRFEYIQDRLFSFRNGEIARPLFLIVRCTKTEITCTVLARIYF